MDGAVELLQDARIRLEQLEPEHTVGGDPCTPVGEVSTPAFCETVKKALRLAKVRLVSSDGRELSTLTLERPLARVDLVNLRRGVSNYQLTVDLTAPFGSYSGKATRFAEVGDGALRWLRAVDVRNGQSVDVAVASTLKTGWKLLPTADGSSEVLQVACRPDNDAAAPDADPAFSVTLSRFALEGDRWQRYTRVKKGFWENDHAFPARAQFP